MAAEHHRASPDQAAPTVAEPAAPGKADDASTDTSGLESALGAECVICGAPSTTHPDDPHPVTSGDGPTDLPAVELCNEHWAAYRTDWLLLGWCVDHYGEALRYCTRHQRVIDPL